MYMHIKYMLYVYARAREKIGVARIHPDRSSAVRHGVSF